MNPASITQLDLTLAAPELFMLAAICVVLLVDLFLTERTRWITPLLSMLALLGVTLVTLRVGFGERTVGLHGTYVADPLATLLKVVAYGAVAVAFLYARGYLAVRGILKGEFYALSETCPHKGGSLAKGIITGLVESDGPGDYQHKRAGEIVRCPWHQWEFDIKTGRSYCDPRRMRLMKYDVKVEPGATLVEGPYVAETFKVDVEGDYVVVEV